jgi:hypothetical protein
MRLQLLKSSVLVFAALVTFYAEASAGIIAVTGDIEIVSPPSSVRRQVYESSSAIRVFLERELQINSFPENAVAPGVYNAYSDFVDATFNPSGPVRSYFIHFDPVGQSLAQRSGSITFAEPILAVIGRSLTMEDTDGTLGSPSTLYPTDRFNRELEYQTRGNYDYFRLETDGHTISTQLECSTDIDIADQNPGDGNGVVGRIFAGISEVYNVVIADGHTVGIDYSIPLIVSVGSTIDFAIDPRSSNDLRDSTRFTSQVEFVPEPSTCVLCLGAAMTLLGCYRRRSSQ